VLDDGAMCRYAEDAGAKLGVIVDAAAAEAKRRGREVSLPSIERPRDGDPMSERVVEQIALGLRLRRRRR
jgi:hypothetical protein